MGNRQKGFSLAEVLIALSLAIFITVMMMGTFGGVEARVSTAQVNNDFQAFQIGLRSFIDEQTAMSRKQWYGPGDNPYDPAAYPDAHFWPGNNSTDTNNPAGDINGEKAVLNRYIDPTLFRMDADPWKRRYHYYHSNDISGSGYHCAIIWSEGPESDNGKTYGVTEVNGGGITGISLNAEKECVIQGSLDSDDPYMILRINPNKVVSVQEINLRNKQ